MPPASGLARRLAPRLARRLALRLAPRLAPRLARRLAPLAGLLLVACTGSQVNPAPTTDEEAFAMGSAMNELMVLSGADSSGMFWTEDESEYAFVAPGLSTGVAGVARGLLAGTLELYRRDLEVAESDIATPSEYYACVQSAADWLLAHQNASQSEPLAASWNQCIDIEPHAVPISRCALASSSQALPVLPCPDELRAPATGYQHGAAGIGQLFLELYSLYQDEDRGFPSPGDPAQEDYLATANGVGLWLAARAHTDGDRAWWSEVAPVDPDDPVAPGEDAFYTGLDRGTAGIGYFLLQLAAVTDPEGNYLELAREAGNWLESLLIDVGEGQAFVPSTSSGASGTPGFYGGNAGIAYFFLALQQATLEVDAVASARYAEDARAILTWLSNPNVAVADAQLGGVTWQSSDLPPGSDPTATFTGLERGNAGIGWTFVQAYQVLGAPYLDSAKTAADWLASPEIAHYYQGLAFWPVLITPWADPPRPPDYGLPSGDEVWSAPPHGLWSGEGVARSVTYYPGILRGLAGIGWFLKDLGLASGAQCYELMSGQAIRWVYYKGQADSSTSALRTWPVTVEHTLGLPESRGPIAAGYEYGIAGMIDFLAWDRVSQDSAAEPLHSILGFRSLSPPGSARLSPPSRTKY